MVLDLYSFQSVSDSRELEGASENGVVVKIRRAGNGWKHTGTAEGDSIGSMIKL